MNDIAYNKLIDAKRINENLRRSKCDQHERVKLTKSLHSILEGHYNKVIFTHDMSRVIQCVIKYCDANIRLAIFQEIKPSVVLMLQSKYAKNCVKSFLKHGSKEIKRDIISALYGNIFKLMCHYVSAPLVELVYTTYCTKDDKTRFRQDFYGGSYKSLSDACENAKDIKLAILLPVKAKLVKILNKYLINSTLLHTILEEFFNVCLSEDKSELITMLRSYIVTLSQTKMGTAVAAQCIWHGNNKDRKVIIKSLKTNVRTVCTLKHGFMTLLTLFDSVDDTVLLKKIILPEIQENLIEIALNEYGRHVISYLVARRNSCYFPPSIIDFLRQGDNNAVSKKPADIREKELLDEIRDPFLDAVTADAATWLSNGAIAMVTLAILKIGSGEKLKSAFEAIAKVICDTDSKITEGEDECSLIEHPGLHMMLKKLIKYDKELLKRNETTFGEILLPHLTSDVLRTWVEVNRASFLLVLLLENESESVVDTLKSRLQSIKDNFENVEETSKNSGKSILLKKLGVR